MCDAHGARVRGLGEQAVAVRTPRKRVGGPTHLQDALSVSPRVPGGQEAAAGGCGAVCEPAATATPSLGPSGPGRGGPAPWVAHPCLDLLVSGELPQLTPLEEEMR